MKSVVFFFVSIAAFLLPFNFSVSATEIHGGNATAQVTQISQKYFAPLPPEYDSSFTAENYTSANVGWLNIQLWDGTYAYINISGSGNFSTNLSVAPYLCSIHGQSFAPNNPTKIYLDLHTSVVATWAGNVVVIDDQEVF